MTLAARRAQAAGASITKQANPRRADSHGFRSLELFIRANPGITYEDFIRAGGRRVDLA